MTSIIHVSDLTEDEAKMELERLSNLIKKYDISYYENNSSLISDSEYDLLRQRNILIEKKFKKLVRKDSPTKRVGSKPSNTFDKVIHKSPMLSLDNIFEYDEVETFLTRIKKLLKKNTSSSIKIFIEPKVDGVSFSAKYKNGKLISASTRGDGKEGEDITESIKLIGDMPKFLNKKIKVPDLIDIRGEVFIKRKNFKNINKIKISRDEKAFSNSRNATSGIVRHINPDPDLLSLLNLYCYTWGQAEPLLWRSQEQYLRCLESWGCPVNSLNFICESPAEIIKSYKEILKKRDSLDYETDGVVYKVNDIDSQNIIGFQSRSPRWAVAHKYPAEEVQTKIKSIDIQIGRTGVLTPVARLNPVFVGGVLVSNATLHNEDEIFRKDIRVNDYVYIQRAGDVIPKVTAVILEKRKKSNIKFKFPTSCPECGSVAIRKKGEAVRRCVAGLSCPAQVIESLKHFVSRNAFDIEGLGGKNIQNFYKLGLINNPVEIFTLEKRDRSDSSRLRNLDGWGKRSIKNLFDSINLKREISFDRFLFSLGIPQVGRNTALLLAKYFRTPDNLPNINIDNNLSDDVINKIKLIDGIGDTIAKDINSFFSDRANINIIKGLLREVKIINFEDANISLSPITNKIIVFTGALTTMTRDEARNYALQHGANITNSISKKTDFLILGKDPGSKYDKAKKMNISIITEEDFRKIVKS
ncbi:MAG: NAD-dependent DNA ligase LigA [Pseudomonadota bacterium]|nr:NAD-dependent DNA ligase LigA [Pseudomonadota bacterium]